MKYEELKHRTLSVMFAGIGCLIFVPSLNAADQNPIFRARQEAIRLREDANQMRDFARINVTWRTHQVYAEMIRDDIRAMQQKAELLDKSTNNQIEPLISELVATTNEVYEAIGQRTSDRVRYNTWLEANYDHAERLAALLSEKHKEN